MTAALLTITVLAQLAGTLQESSYLYVAQDRDLEVKVRIVVSRFVKADHKYFLKSLKPGNSPRVFIDGKFAWGLEGVDEIEYPEYETKKLEVWFGNNHFDLPKEAYSDIYDPNAWDEFRSNWHTGPRLWVSKEKNLLRFKMFGSDGAAGYRVLWTVHADGKWSRDIDSTD